MYKKYLPLVYCLVATLLLPALLMGQSQKTIDPNPTQRHCQRCEGGGGGGGGTPVCTTNSTLYVDASRPDNNGSGYTWATAKKTLHAALYIANSCPNITTVNVAKGTYKASNTTTPTSETRNNNFFIGDTYNLYGGFPTGGGTRDWVDNPTILDGEIVDLYEAYHVVTIYGATGSVTIDGFQIKNGFADGTGSVELDPGVNMGQDDGSGFYIRNADNVTIRNCAIYNNVANGNGAGILAQNSNVSLVNVVVANNTVAANGAGVYLTTTSTSTMNNCTFYNNNSLTVATGGAIYNNAGTSLVVSNTIVWGNSSALGGGGSRSMNFSLVQGGIFAGTSGGTSYNICQVANPRFLNAANLDGADNIWFTADDGLSLAFCSPAINRGNNNSPSAKDISNNARVYNLQTDIGAYERQSISGVSAPADRSVAGDTTNTYLIAGNTALVADGNCRIIANLEPFGANPIAGRIIAKTYVEPGNVSYNGQPYLSRHTDINNVANANSNTNTGNVTLWFSNTEFLNYNQRAEAVAKLPSTDGSNKQDLRIVQYLGTSATALPGTYPGAYNIIDPLDADIVWNPVSASWKISFDATGLGGFFVTAIPKYSFVGNGNWSDATNWTNSKVPPSVLPSWCEIVITQNKHCILNVPEVIFPEAKLTVETGAIFEIKGSLSIVQ